MKDILLSEPDNAALEYTKHGRYWVKKELYGKIIERANLSHQEPGDLISSIYQMLAPQEAISIVNIRNLALEASSPFTEITQGKVRNGQRIKGRNNRKRTRGRR